MNKKGFTLIELLILGAIIGIFAALIIPAFMDDAHGMEINKLMPADDASVKEVIRLMKNDPHLTVTVMAYSLEWTQDTVGPILGRAREVMDALYKSGIYANRVAMLFANKGGLAEDPMPTPADDGVYLYLE